MSDSKAEAKAPIVIPVDHTFTGTNHFTIHVPAVHFAKVAVRNITMSAAPEGTDTYPGSFDFYTTGPVRQPLLTINDGGRRSKGYDTYCPGEHCGGVVVVYGSNSAAALFGYRLKFELHFSQPY
jgi:hypothetical protein